MSHKSSENEKKNINKNGKLEDEFNAPSSSLKRPLDKSDISQQSAKRMHIAAPEQPAPTLPETENPNVAGRKVKESGPPNPVNDESTKETSIFGMDPTWRSPEPFKFFGRAPQHPRSMESSTSRLPDPSKVADEVPKQRRATESQIEKPKVKSHKVRVQTARRILAPEAWRCTTEQLVSTPRPAPTEGRAPTQPASQTSPAAQKRRSSPIPLSAPKRRRSHVPPATPTRRFLPTPQPATPQRPFLKEKKPEESIAALMEPKWLPPDSLKFFCREPQSPTSNLPATSKVATQVPKQRRATESQIEKPKVKSHKVRVQTPRRVLAPEAWRCTTEQLVPTPRPAPTEGRAPTQPASQTSPAAQKRRSSPIPLSAPKRRRSHVPPATPTRRFLPTPQPATPQRPFLKEKKTKESIAALMEPRWLPPDSLKFFGREPQHPRSMKSPTSNLPGTSKVANEVPKERRATESQIEKPKVKGHKVRVQTPRRIPAPEAWRCTAEQLASTPRLASTERRVPTQPPSQTTPAAPISLASPTPPAAPERWSSQIPPTTQTRRPLVNDKKQEETSVFGLDPKWRSPEPFKFFGREPQRPRSIKSPGPSKVANEFPKERWATESQIEKPKVTSHKVREPKPLHFLSDKKPEETNAGRMESGQLPLVPSAFSGKEPQYPKSMESSTSSSPINIRTTASAVASHVPKEASSTEPKIKKHKVKKHKVREPKPLHFLNDKKSGHVAKGAPGTELKIKKHKAKKHKVREPKPLHFSSNKTPEETNAGRMESGQLPLVPSAFSGKEPQYPKSMESSTSSSPINIRTTASAVASHVPKEASSTEPKIKKHKVKKHKVREPKPLHFSSDKKSDETNAGRMESGQLSPTPPAFSGKEPQHPKSMESSTSSSSINTRTAASTVASHVPKEASATEPKIKKHKVKKHKVREPKPLHFSSDKKPEETNAGRMESGQLSAVPSAYSGREPQDTKSMESSTSSSPINIRTTASPVESHVPKEAPATEPKIKTHKVKKHKVREPKPLHFSSDKKSDGTNAVRMESGQLPPISPAFSGKEPQHPKSMESSTSSSPINIRTTASAVASDVPKEAPATEPKIKKHKVKKHKEREPKPLHCLSNKKPEKTNAGRMETVELPPAPPAFSGKEPQYPKSMESSTSSSPINIRTTASAVASHVPKEASATEPKIKKHKIEKHKEREPKPFHFSSDKKPEETNAGRMESGQLPPVPPAFSGKEPQHPKSMESSTSSSPINIRTTASTVASATEPKIKKHKIEKHKEREPKPFHFSSDKKPEETNAGRMESGQLPPVPPALSGKEPQHPKSMESSTSSSPINIRTTASTVASYVPKEASATEPQIKKHKIEKHKEREPKPFHFSSNKKPEETNTGRMESGQLPPIPSAFSGKEPQHPKSMESSTSSSPINIRIIASTVESHVPKEAPATESQIKIPKVKTHKESDGSNVPSVESGRLSPSKFKTSALVVAKQDLKEPAAASSVIETPRPKHSNTGSVEPEYPRVIPANAFSVEYPTSISNALNNINTSASTEANQVPNQSAAGLPEAQRARSWNFGMGSVEPEHHRAIPENAFSVEYPTSISNSLNNINTSAVTGINQVPQLPAAASPESKEFKSWDLAKDNHWGDFDLDCLQALWDPQVPDNVFDIESPISYSNSPPNINTSALAVGNKDPKQPAAASSEIEKPKPWHSEPEHRRVLPPNAFSVVYPPSISNALNNINTSGSTAPILSKELKSWDLGKDGDWGDFDLDCLQALWDPASPDNDFGMELPASYSNPSANINASALAVANKDPQQGAAASPEIEKPTPWYFDNDNELGEFEIECVETVWDPTAPDNVPGMESLTSLSSSSTNINASAVAAIQTSKQPTAKIDKSMIASRKVRMPTWPTWRAQPDKESEEVAIVGEETEWRMPIPVKDFKKKTQARNSKDLPTSFSNSSTKQPGSTLPTVDNPSVATRKVRTPAWRIWNDNRAREMTGVEPVWDSQFPYASNSQTSASTISGENQPTRLNKNKDFLNTDVLRRRFHDGCVEEGLSGVTDESVEMIANAARDFLKDFIGQVTAIARDRVDAESDEHQMALVQEEENKFGFMNEVQNLIDSRVSEVNKDRLDIKEDISEKRREFQIRNTNETALAAIGGRRIPSFSQPAPVIKKPEVAVNVELKDCIFYMENHRDFCNSRLLHKSMLNQS